MTAELTPTVLDLARELIAFDTSQPGGSERQCAGHLAALLGKNGFAIKLLEFAPGRTSLVAELEGQSEGPPICLAGHLDTVPPGTATWAYDPLAGEVADGRLFGRGASDMKGGIAAITVAAIRAARMRLRGRGLKLVFTAGEEQGCLGSLHLAATTGALGRPAGALVVAEPTSNRPVCCHRGALWLEISVAGRTAHGSMPHLGDNAIYTAAAMIGSLQHHSFDAPPHPLLGPATLNVGTFSGGQNVNSVPDRACFAVDIRTLPGMSHVHVRDRIARLVGPGAAIKVLADLPAVETDPDDPWFCRVQAVAQRVLGADLPVLGKFAFTDAAVLKPAFNDCPIVILGPGIQEMCHQTDEYCLASALDQAVEMYDELIRSWCMRD